MFPICCASHAMTATTETSPAPPIPPEAAASIGLMGRPGALARRRATWVMIDQAVVSGGNFLTISLLSRALERSDAGIFAVLLETMNYLNSLQAALIVYPLTIKGATGERSNLGRLATGSILLTLVLLPILGTAIAGSVGALNGGHFAVAAVMAMLLWQ